MKINVIKSSLPDLDEYVDEIKDIWDSHWLTNMGIKHETLKEELKKYLKVDNIDLLTNGHMALELSIQALGLTTGEVITSPFTFASTTHAIVRNGLTPVFCDIDPDTYCIDANKIEDLITDKTVAIMPIHVYGNICDVEKIDEIAKKHNLKVIYDAAHAFGEEYKDKGICSYGDVSCLSFHATKVYHTIEGGAVCFKDKEFGDSIYELKNFGIKGEESVVSVGANAKMNEFCAAMGLVNLRHIDENIKKRGLLVEQYRKHLEGVKGIKLCPKQDNVKSNYAYFPVVFEDGFGYSRDEIKDILAKNDIGTRKYFYPIVNEFECYKDKYDSSLTPIALDISNKVLTLPLYADLDLEDVDRICEIIIGLKNNEQ